MHNKKHFFYLKINITMAMAIIMAVGKGSVAVISIAVAVTIIVGTEVASMAVIIASKIMTGKVWENFLQRV